MDRDEKERKKKKRAKGTDCENEKGIQIESGKNVRG
jgi:hypothetical protein